MKRYSGVLLIGTGYLHNIIGIYLFWSPLNEIVGDGLWNTIYPHYDRATAVWFLLFGMVILTLGHTIKWMNQNGINIPRFIGWHLLGISVIGAFIDPVSGFWLVIPQAIILLQKPKNPTAITVGK
jgi:hypothetical protein